MGLSAFAAAAAFVLKADNPDDKELQPELG
jgi:hypothetical protein